MIKVNTIVDGKEYVEPFSKGIMAKSLNVPYIGSKMAYELASEIEEELIRNNVSMVSRDELSNMVLDHLTSVDPKIAEKYKNLSIIRNSKKPLIILIGGASGVGTSSMALELANRLRWKNIISTDMIREVMRKCLSKELSPIIHKSSYNAYETIESHSIDDDLITGGFIAHVNAVKVGIEAIIERSIKEGISTIIEGVHIVPGFINKELIDNNNIVMLILTVEDEELHKQHFYSRCSQPWVKRSIETYMDNFDSIRTTQDFLVEQAKIHDSYIIDNVEINETIDFMVNDILEFVGVNDVK